MAAIVSTSSKSTPLIFSERLHKEMLALEAIRLCRGNINEIRMLFKGNIEECIRLFKDAVKEKDVILQIELSYALYGMREGKDNAKDFSAMVVGDLETFTYSFKGFELFISAYDQAMEVISNFYEAQDRAAETFRLAANRDYLPAVLEHLYALWDNKYETGYFVDHRETFGFAVQLRPFINRGNRDFDLLFGTALKKGCKIGSKLYYEGLYWLAHHNGIHLQFPEKGQTFEELQLLYKEGPCQSDYYEIDGFAFVDSMILAPSREAWEAFVKEKLGSISIAPVESYLFDYDAGKIHALLKGKVITSTPDADTVILSSLEDDKPIVELSAINVKIHQSCEHLKPVMDFIKNVLSRGGTSQSVRAWLKQMGCEL